MTAMHAPELRDPRVVTRYATNGAVAAANDLATSAGAATLTRGGNEVDAAITAAAVMTATSPHMCGLGGDLIALVSRPGTAPEALNASGRAGSGADPDHLRAQGFNRMPFQHDMHSVTLPGCVAGWAALHERYGSIELAETLASARRLASLGFPVSPTLAESSADLSPQERDAAFGVTDPLTPGQPHPTPRHRPSASSDRRPWTPRLPRARGRMAL